MKKPTQTQTWVGLAFATLSLVSGILGVDKYQQSQVIVQPSEVNVAITSIPSGVTHTHRSTENIQAMIDKAVEARMDDHIHKEGRH
jgi:type IV secretory pathway TrbF-like protein